MISQIKQKGFTIVELLIVIVVIAILAALSYVGYTSITARANTSTAAASAKAVKDAAQTFNGAHGSWPTSKADMVSGYPSGGTASDAISKLPNDIVFAADAAAINGLSSTAPKTVLVERSPSTGTITGFRITYRDFSKSQNVQVTVGETTTFATTAVQ